MGYHSADSPRETCGKCAHGEFLGSSSTGACEVVAGKIEVSMVCDRFEAEKPEETEPKSDPEQAPAPAGNPFGS